MIAIRSYLSGAVKAHVEPDDNVVLSQEILGMDAVQLAFELPVFVRFGIGDYTDLFGQRYYLTTNARENKTGNRNYAYTLNMEGEQHKLGRTQYQKPNGIGQFLDSTFFINSTADTFMQLVIDNMERMFPGEGWKLGFVVDNGVRNLAFDGVNCLEALSTLAEAFETEWLVEGRTIHLYRKQNATGLVLRQGKDEALYSLTRQPQSNGNIVTRLYAYGSSRNLPFNYRNGATKLRMGDLTYIDRHTDTHGVWEDSTTFDDIYPRRVGTVTAADAGNPLVFADSGLDFDVNTHLVDGVTAKVVFETGQLAGYEFQLNAFNNGTKTFTLNKNTQETAIDVPGEHLRPQVGDEYILVDIRMPGTYVLAAEEELRQKAIAHIDERLLSDATYSCECNPLFFKRRGIVLRLADTVTVLDAAMGINEAVRVVKISRNVRNPNIYTVELARKARENIMVKLISSLQ